MLSDETCLTKRALAVRAALWDFSKGAILRLL